jgi:20S proteasome alpha/beta subunit
MTCIVGLEYKDNIYIGTDSAGTSGYNITIRNDEKVFHVYNFLIGFTGSFRMGQLLRYSLKVKEKTETQTDHEYMCTTFVDSVRECLKKGGYLIKKDEEEVGGLFIVGFNKKLYRIERDFQVGIHKDPYICIGCGEEYALGSLDTQFKLFHYDEIKPTKLIKTALETATKYSNAVAPPFIIKTQET